MSQGLLTTSVGSLPKPDYLIRARNKVARGEMDPSSLEPLERQATEHWIHIQEELGLDILVDGEMYRGDMVTYFAEHWEGFSVSGLVRSYGNRYYRKPIAVGPVGRAKPTTIDWWKHAQGLTDKPVKGMLTGPYTICDWSFDEYYGDREAFIMDLAKAVHSEAMDLEKAGARYIQIDEPAVSARPEEMDLATRALAVVTKDLNAYTFTHICYGDFGTVFPDLLQLPVDNLDLEMANRNFDMLEEFRTYSSDKAISMGVTDVHNHLIESVDYVKKGINMALQLFPPHRLYIDPDCGLKTRSEEEAIAKLKVMIQAVREVKEEHNIE